MSVTKNLEQLFDENNKYIKILGVAVIVGSGVGVLFGAYSYWKSNIWHPVVDVIDVDFANAVAILNINGKQKTLYGNSVLAAGGQWGVRFGTTAAAADSFDYNTIELVKNDMVYSIYTTEYEQEQSNASQ